MEGDACPPSPGCDLGDLFRLLGRAHNLGILHVALKEDGPVRFVDLQHRLEMSPNTLSARLKELTGAGLLERKVFNEIPPRVEYTATEKACNLRTVFRALHEWSQKHTLTVDTTEAEAAAATPA